MKSDSLARMIAPVARFRGPVELGWYDFITRFRRAYFGALWVPFQFILWIGTLSLVLHDALGADFRSYVVYIGVGFFVWELLSSALGEGPTHFTSREGLLKNVPISLANLTVRKLSFLFSRSLFQLPVVIVLVLVFGDLENPMLLLWLAPAPVFLACVSYAILVIMGLVGSFYRDAAFLNASLVRFLFFTSPVFWRGDSGVRKIISDYNPIAYYLELARAPIEGRAPATLTWIVVASISLGSLFLALWVQSAFRNRLIYSL